jgi:hypothetical protein
LEKTQLRIKGLFFPNAMGAMRDSVLGIKRAKRVGGLEGGISGRGRVTFELFGGIGWAGIRWDGDWHWAKEGLWLLVSQAPKAGPLEA